MIGARGQDKKGASRSVKTTRHGHSCVCTPIAQRVAWSDPEATMALIMVVGTCTLIGDLSAQTGWC